MPGPVLTGNVEHCLWGAPLFDCCSGVSEIDIIMVDSRMPTERNSSTYFHTISVLTSSNALINTIAVSDARSRTSPVKSVYPGVSEYIHFGCVNIGNKEGGINRNAAFYFVLMVIGNPCSVFEPSLAVRGARCKEAASANDVFPEPPWPISATVLTALDAYSFLYGMLLTMYSLIFLQVSVYEMFHPRRSISVRCNTSLNETSHTRLLAKKLRST